MISCLLVTSPVAERFAFFKRSVGAYCRQTHAEKELIVVFAGAAANQRAAILDFIASRNRTDIHVVECGEGATLGALRNTSRNAARGEIICQWDDDDLYHPERLQRQCAALTDSDAEAVLLQDVMQYFPHRHEMVWTNWIATDAKGHPGTLMCRRDAPIAYPEHGPQSMRGEDLAVTLQLHARGQVQLLAGMPHLYIYVSHGQNTCAIDHHVMLARELSISQGLLRKRETQLRAGLEDVNFGTASAITVIGHNGPAFTIEPSVRRVGDPA